MLNKLSVEVVRVVGGVVLALGLIIVMALCGLVCLEVVQLMLKYIHVCDCETIPRKLHLH